MILKDVSFRTPQENILFDEVLLHLAEQGATPQTLRFWESKELFIVLGKIGRLKEEVCVKSALQQRIPVVRRFSGGGAVLQGPGCLNFSLILSKSQDPTLDDLHRSYRFILGKVAQALSLLKVEAVFQPPSDLSLKETNKKISGNAQHRARRYILHHGTLLYQFDLIQMERFLKMPRQMPFYRRNRAHEDFVANLPLKGEDLDIKKAFQRVFGAEQEQNHLTLQEDACLKDFLKNKPTLVDLNNSVIF